MILNPGAANRNIGVMTATEQDLSIRRNPDSMGWHYADGGRIDADRWNECATTGLAAWR